MESTQRIKSDVPLTYGLVAGLIMIVITLMLYLGGLDMYMSPVGSGIYLVVITFAVLAALKVRKQNEGFIDFRQALKVTFGVFALAILMHTLFTYVLFNFIDVPFKEAETVETLNKTEQWLQKAGMSESEIEKVMESERSKDQYSIGRTLLGYGTFCIISFIFCLLISVIVRKNKPAFSNI